MSLEDIAPKLISRSARFFGDLRFCLVVLMKEGAGDIAQLVKCLLVCTRSWVQYPASPKTRCSGTHLS